MKSTTRFPMSLTLRCPKNSQRGLKTQSGRLQCKIAHCLKKVCYKVSFCENCQRQSYWTFIGLSIRTKMIGGVLETPPT